MLTQTLTQNLTLILTLIPTLAQTLTQTLTQTKEKHYFAFRGKIATFRHEKGLYCRNWLLPVVYNFNFQESSQLKFKIEL